MDRRSLRGAKGYSFFSLAKSVVFHSTAATFGEDSPIALFCCLIASAVLFLNRRTSLPIGS